jgi:hypothetical protein
MYMKSKDQILLEEAYSNIVKENKINVLGGKVTLGGDVVPDENSIKSSNGEYSGGEEPYTETEEELKESDEELLKDIAAIESLPQIGWSTSIFLKGLKDEAKRRGILKTNINPSNTTSDMTYAKKGGYVESFVHGIQPIVEAKKKVNPWAIEKSIEKKTGKKFGKKHKEDIIKGIKKSSKKYGKKITSDKVEPKKK